MIEEKKIIGRLAPSPTGFLHLGNAWAFLLAYLACRLENGKLYLRMEDIDLARCKKSFAKAILEDFNWLGIDYDEEIIWQSERFDLYEEALQKLSGLTYNCYCSRKELRDLAGAPQVNKDSQNFENNSLKHKQRFVMPDAGAPYHGTCRLLSFEQRDLKAKAQKNACLRIACPPFALPQEEYLFTEYLYLCNNVAYAESEQNQKFCLEKLNIPNMVQENKIKFIDLLYGKQNFSLEECGGDFALKRSDGVFSYQLAVVCDDIYFGVNQIVRGNDILTSSPRQLYLHSLLGNSDISFAHIPLLLDAQGERLAKRHQSKSLANMREQGIKAKEIISYFAKLMFIDGEYYSAKDLLNKLKKAGHNKFPWEKLIPYCKQSGIIIDI